MEGNTVNLTDQNPKKKSKKSSPSRIQTARSILSSGLFYRPQKSTVPLAASLQKLTIKAEESETKDEAEKVINEKETKRINRYTKF